MAETDSDDIAYFQALVELNTQDPNQRGLDGKLKVLSTFVKLQQLDNGKIISSAELVDVMKYLRSSANNLRRIDPMQLAQAYLDLLPNWGIEPGKQTLGRITYSNRNSPFVTRGSLTGTTAPEWVKSLGPGRFPSHPEEGADSIVGGRRVGLRTMAYLPQPMDVYRTTGARWQRITSSIEDAPAKRDNDGDRLSFFALFKEWWHQKEGEIPQYIGGPGKSPVLLGPEVFRTEQVTLKDIAKFADFDFLNFNITSKVYNLTDAAKTRSLKSALVNQITEYGNLSTYTEHFDELKTQNSYSSVADNIIAVQAVTIADAIAKQKAHPSLSIWQALKLSMDSGKLAQSENNSAMGAGNKGLGSSNGYSDFEVSPVGIVEAKLSQRSVYFSKQKPKGQVQPKKIIETNLDFFIDKPSDFINWGTPFTSAQGGVLIRELTGEELDIKNFRELTVKSRFAEGMRKNSETGEVFIDQERLDQIKSVMSDTTFSAQAIDIESAQVEFVQSITGKPVIPKAYLMSTTSVLANGQLENESVFAEMGFVSGIPTLGLNKRVNSSGQVVYSGKTVLLSPLYIAGKKSTIYEDPLDYLAKTALAHSIPDTLIPGGKRVFGEVQSGGGQWSYRRKHLRAMVGMTVPGYKPEGSVASQNLYLQRGTQAMLDHYKMMLENVEQETPEELSILRSLQYHIDSNVGYTQKELADYEMEIKSFYNKNGTKVNVFASEEAILNKQNKLIGMHWNMGVDETTMSVIQTRAFVTSSTMRSMVSDDGSTVKQIAHLGFDSDETQTASWQRFSGFAWMGTKGATPNGYTIVFKNPRTDELVTSAKRKAQIQPQITSSITYETPTALVSFDLRNEIQQMFKDLADNPASLGDFADKGGESAAYLSNLGRRAIEAQGLGPQIHQIPTIALAQGDLITQDIGIVYRGLITEGAPTVQTSPILSAQEYLNHLLEEVKSLGSKGTKSVMTNVDEIAGAGTQYGVALVAGELNAKGATAGLVIEGLRNRAKNDNVIKNYLDMYLPDNTEESFKSFSAHLNSSEKHIDEFYEITARLKIQTPLALSLKDSVSSGTGYDLGVLTHHAWTGYGGKPGENQNPFSTKSTSPIGQLSVLEFMRTVFPELDREIGENGKKRNLAEKLLEQATEDYWATSGKGAQFKSILDIVERINLSGERPVKNTYIKLVNSGEAEHIRIVGQGLLEGIQLSLDEGAVPDGVNLLKNPHFLEALVHTLKMGETVRDRVEKGRNGKYSVEEAKAVIASRGELPTGREIVQAMLEEGQEILESEFRTARVALPKVLKQLAPSFIKKSRLP